MEELKTMKSSNPGYILDKLSILVEKYSDLSLDEKACLK
jgi:hypothetical protein